MIPKGFLTNKQQEIWKHLSRKTSKAEIGRILGITRQAVHYAEEAIIPKVEQALIQVAYSNMLDIKHIDVTNGVLLGYSPSSKNKVIITFSATNGIQTWHYQNPNCSQCEWVKRCRKRLIEEALERGITLSKTDENMPPSKLALHIFSKIIPELQI